ncbi:MAG: sugar phosphate isomerase/epimerase [Clostridia bacterium]|nr:sugar phosphate isomerase/epimerase [Clostridia bacterium]
MKLAFSTLGCPNWTFNEIFATAKDLGFDGVEIRGIGKEIFAPDIAEFSDSRIDAALAKIKRLGIEIPCVTSGICVKDYGLDAAADRKAVEDAEKYAALAAKLGAHYVRILGDSDVMPRGEVSDERVATALEDMLAAAAGTGVKLLIETNGAYADSARLAALVEKIADPGLGVLWDVHHPYRFFREEIGKTWENIGKYAEYLHVKDSVMLPSGVVRYKMMGTGDLPLQELIRLLKENGYGGFISLEWVKRWCQELEAPGIVFVHYINYMKKALA